MSDESDFFSNGLKATLARIEAGQNYLVKTLENHVETDTSNFEEIKNDVKDLNKKTDIIHLELTTMKVTEETTRRIVKEAAELESIKVGRKAKIWAGIISGGVLALQQFIELISKK